tara:strand:+ start:3927 stop:4616 length:690 start_codon:yes stop_codon:yes gene_type:complete
MSSSAVTVKDIVNKILTRMRESTVGSINSTDQASAILRLVNDAKREVEDNFNWTALQDSVTVTTSAGTHTYTLEEGSVYTNQRSRVVDVFNDTTDVRLVAVPYDYARRQSQTTNDEQAEPVHFAVAGYTATQSLQIRFYQTPDAAYSMVVEVVNPQEDLNADAQYTKVPWYPVYLRALALAIRERGEDEGEQYSEVQRAFQQAIGDAIAYEQQHKYQGDGGDWKVLGDY